MRLKTTMVGPDSTSAGPYPSADDDGQALLHDAACAHALMLAAKENCVLDCVTHRASELLREWGFDSGEDA